MILVVVSEFSERSLVFNDRNVWEVILDKLLSRWNLGGNVKETISHGFIAHLFEFLFEELFSFLSLMDAVGDFAFLLIHERQLLFGSIFKIQILIHLFKFEYFNSLELFL